MEALILPGILNSGPDHWQTHWERQHPSFVRIRHRDWVRPVCDEWVEALESTLSMSAGSDVVLVAHSLGCDLVPHWAERTGKRIKGALLVAPPDPDNPNFPADAVGFAPLPLKQLPFPSIVVASENDPYGTLEFASRMASAWGSHFVNVGPLGHINADSGLGEWRDGLVLYRRLADWSSVPNSTPE
ncbi:MAG: alpha/beta hydrolase [Chromatiaceae bacterium]|nr:alpha/beta hydrolase [Chromatiaceae bacterium]MCP5315827.1 alpha/beta hydrolase [Chromatiaceae bacterium]